MPGGEQEGKGTQENCSATWLTVLGFMVMGLVSGLSLASHSALEVFVGGRRETLVSLAFCRGTACQASLSITNSWSSLKLTSIKSVMPSSHLILCCPLLLLPPIPPRIIQGDFRHIQATMALWLWCCLAQAGALCAQVESSRVREPRRTALPRVSQS